MKFIYLILLCLYVIFIGCNNEKELHQINRYGGEIRIALNTAIKDLFPLTTDEFSVDQIHKYMLTPTLVSFDVSGNAIPDLANIWQLNEEKLSLTFILNSEMRWSNGQYISSTDIKYSYDLMKSIPDLPQFAPQLKNIRKVEIIDSITCKFTFNQAVADPLFFVNFPIVYADNNYDTTSLEKLKKSYIDSFVGCGPFLISVSNKDSLVLVKNPTYGLNSVYLNKVTFDFVGSPESLLTSIVKNNTDFAVNLPIDIISKKLVQNKFNIISYPEKGYTFIAWNLNSRFLKSKKIRLALSHAIDRQTIVDGILGGYADLINGPVYFDKNLENKQMVNIDYNTVKAESLFVADKWVYNNTYGAWTKNGQKFSIKMLVNKENKERVEIGKNIKANLTSFGIDVQLNFVSWNTLLNATQRKSADAVLLTWTDGDHYDPSLLFHSRSIKNGLNFMSYNSAVADSLIDNALFTWDKKKKDESWNALQKTIAQDLPCTFLFSQKVVVGYSKKINNVRIDSRGFLINIKEWWLN